MKGCTGSRDRLQGGAGGARGELADGGHKVQGPAKIPESEFARDLCVAVRITTADKSHCGTWGVPFMNRTTWLAAISSPIRVTP